MFKKESEYGLVLKIIFDELAPYDDPTKPLIDRCLTLVRTIKRNAFGANDTKFLYHMPSFIQHSCKPNVMFSVDEKGKGVLIALDDIFPEDELRICYTDEEDVTEKKNQLRTIYDLDCNCGYCHLTMDGYITQVFERCLRCKRTTSLKTCTGCYLCKYCSVKCQHADWKRHRSYCKHIRYTKA